MEKILPTYDQERVYVSDIKKLVTWYNTLLSLNMLSFEEEPAAEKEAGEPAAEETPKKVPVPKKKTSKPKTQK
jgi:hypothetical protein